MPLTEETYLWEHWKFNGEQCLKGFSLFFVMQFVFGVMCTGYGLWQLCP